MTDLLGGQVQVYFGTISESIEYIRTGRLRALAVTTAMRSDVLPDIPAWAIVPGYEAAAGRVSARPGTRPPTSSISSTRRSNAGIADPKLEARLADLGSMPLKGSPADFGKFIADETEKWAKVIKFQASGRS